MTLLLTITDRLSSLAIYVCPLRHFLQCMYGLYVITIVMADLCHSECVNISSVRIQMFNVSDIGEFMTPLQPQQVCWISQAACCMYINLYLYPAFWNFCFTTHCSIIV